jgi:hypothetical protein
MKIGYSCDLDTKASCCPFFLLKKGEDRCKLLGQVQTSWTGANIF